MRTQLQVVWCSCRIQGVAGRNYLVGSDTGREEVRAVGQGNRRTVHLHTGNIKTGCAKAVGWLRASINKSWPGNTTAKSDGVGCKEVCRVGICNRYVVNGQICCSADYVADAVGPVDKAVACSRYCRDRGGIGKVVEGLRCRSGNATTDTCHKVKDVGIDGEVGQVTVGSHNVGYHQIGVCAGRSASFSPVDKVVADVWHGRYGGGAQVVGNGLDGVTRQRTVWTSGKGHRIGRDGSGTAGIDG